MIYFVFNKKKENDGDDIIINKEDLFLNLNINNSNKKNDIKIINNKYISNDDNISTDKYKQKEKKSNCFWFY